MSPFLRPNAPHFAQDPSPLPADIYQPNTPSQCQQVSKYLYPSSQRKCTVYLEIFPPKKLLRQNGDWQRHHNSSGASGPAIAETGGKGSSLFTAGLIVSPRRCRPCIIAGKSKALLLFPGALPAHSHTAGSHQPRSQHRAPQPCSQHEPAAGPGGGDRYLYPATQESSNVPLAGICLQNFPH